MRDVRVDIDGERHPPKICLKNKGIKKSKSSLSGEENFRREDCKSKKWSNGVHSEVLHIDDSPLPALTQGEAVGIITLEDVIEEILQVRGFVVYFSPANLIFNPDYRFLHAGGDF